MAFDDKTRGRLQKLVTTCRGLLTDEFRIQVQQTYGMDPNTGDVTPLERLTHLSAAERETADLLRQTLAHYLTSEGLADSATQRVPIIDRIVREQAFTVLNRLAALLMMEARGVLQRPAVGSGQQSPAFELYKMVAGSALGETGQAYQTFLFSLFDEFAQELPALFDRFAPQGRLFPREAVLLQVLAELNHHEIQPLWGEDETIGWIYQYFNSKDERKAMRDASPAPRNSRELAVRNQFFTPRYVVEFLVDNTLGRLWLNATRGHSGLRERCQYLLVQPGEQPNPVQRVRDPRTLKLLDPACGSMHFGLYAFDLLLLIYREAWNWEQAHGAGSLDTSTQPEAGLQPLCHAYADLAAYLRDVPRLVIEHNIYGVDIDPRAAQIASLALWLRAQRAWHDDEVRPQHRPVVGQGHVVSATAAPAEKELREQFAAQLDSLDAKLFGKTLEMLRGVPELGVLLQVERDLPNLVRSVFGDHGSLFRDADLDRWRKAEIRLRSALAEFSLTAKGTFQRGLFARDALQGLRLIDLCREKFDVIVMNPPFGSPSINTDDLKERYGNSGRDIYAMFVERALQLKRDGGFIGALLPRTGLFIETMTLFRREVLLSRALTTLVDLGKDVLDDATVRTACYVLGEPQTLINCLRIGNVEERESKLRALIRSANSVEEDEDFFCRSQADFLSMPSCSIAYWIPEATAEAITKMGRLGNVVDVRQGIATGDNFRFLRSYTEIINGASDYSYYSKGGEPVPFFSDEGLYVKSVDSCAEMKAYAAANYGSASRTIKNEDTFFKCGITYSQVNDAGLRFRLHPKGGIYDMKGPVLFMGGDDATLDMLAFLNSSAVEDFMRMTTDGRQWHVSALKGLPFPAISDATRNQLDALAREAVSIRLQKVACDETSHAFSFGRKFLPLACEISREIEILNKIDDIVWGCYGVAACDVEKVKRQRVLFLERELPTDDSVEDGGQTTAIDIAIGVAFGRFDIRLATGERTVLIEIDPIGPLPIKSPGMLPDGVSPFHSNDGILVDDAGHEHDLVRVVEEVLSRVDVPVPSSLRRWVRKEFFPLHFQRYSKGRRKTPIYWPLSTVSGNYTLWLYYPKISRQTLYTAVNDFVEPKLQQVNSDVTALRNKGAARTRDDEKRFEALQTLEAELVELRDQMLKLAPVYEPSHDDGVQISAAPMWQLFRHKPWQKVLKDTWAKLEKGDYDWAHLAMAYWPDRVREKCKTDKSLAIAHGLESLYIEPEAAPKKTRGRKKTGGDE